MKRQWIPVLMSACACLGGGAADAIGFYSVDVNTNQLVRVDSDTGVGTPLIDLGIDMVNPDLACVGDYLYVLDSDYYGGTGVRLIKVDMVSLQIVSDVTVTQDGRPIPNAEGLAALDGRLLIAYCGECVLDGPWSNAIGELSESGAITLIYDYLLLDPRADADGLVALPNGYLLSMDIWYTGDNYRVSELILPPDEEFIPLGVFAPAVWMNDLAVLDDGDIWGVDPTEHHLNRLGPDGSVLESRPFDASLNLFGLVGDVCGGGPSPANGTTWGHIKSLYK